jgi:hypothetical protein
VNSTNHFAFWPRRLQAGVFQVPSWWDNGGILSHPDRVIDSELKSRAPVCDTLLKIHVLPNTACSTSSILTLTAAWSSSRYLDFDLFFQLQLEPFFELSPGDSPVFSDCAE